MHHLRRLLAALALTVTGAFAVAGVALADMPRNWHMGMQPPAGPIQVGISNLNDMVEVIITVITLLVAGLLGWVMYRYNARRHPTPSQTSHNTVLEVAWTVLPVLILVVIAIPSFRLVYYQERTPNADMTIKVTGHQWYWEYTYPDHDNINFSSRMVPDEQSKLRLLEADEQLVVPAGKNIRVLTTGADVIHSFFVPSLGVQRYAIPGRTIETWLRADRPGVFYGECNQICGTNHPYMPIVVHAVPEAEFTTWLAQAKTKYASNGGAQDGAAPAPDASRLADARIQPRIQH